MEKSEKVKKNGKNWKKVKKIGKVKKSEKKVKFFFHFLKKSEKNKHFLKNIALAEAFWIKSKKKWKTHKLWKKIRKEYAYRILVNKKHFFLLLYESKKNEKFLKLNKKKHTNFEKLSSFFFFPFFFFLSNIFGYRRKINTFWKISELEQQIRKTKKNCNLLGCI